ncbi:BMP family ABC transporter substrate-binding protein [Bacillus sp. 1P06AnD]|uniref:BMP family ABC transporter substrate-binding protein n=1 Tax=Bacillus sp. 1P06AnD TaxID=3132208 RepID=UPI00399FCA33
MGSTYKANIFVKEKMDTAEKINNAVDQFEKMGLNLVIGNGQLYSQVFNTIANRYSSVHFVTVNGNAIMGNETNMDIEGYAMGYFGGMTAAKMSSTHRIGAIGAYEWQPELKGFFDGAFIQNPETKVTIVYTHSWDNVEKALKEMDKMIADDLDVLYPAGDGYNVEAINKMKEKGLFAIGYITDQSYLGRNTVLTSTEQHIDQLYVLAADQFYRGKLPSGNISYDFEEGITSMGQFSPSVPLSFRQQLLKQVEIYKKTGVLPVKGL